MNAPIHAWFRSSLLLVHRSEPARIFRELRVIARPVQNAKDSIANIPESPAVFARTHGKNTNCLFVDGHSDKVYSMAMTSWDWGLLRDAGRP